LGYAPDSWDATGAHFKSRGYAEKDLLDAGLVSERDSGGVHDRFRHRVMFPIRDERGRMAGFGARILNPEDVPKFLNSPQTPIFDKGRLLYGLERARKSIRSQDQAVIVEGYLDVVALHQAGYTNAVSPMGTALTEHQLYSLKKLTRRIVLALDSDAAGDKATLRGLQVARQALDHESDPVFDARGLLGYEARLQADIRVTTLPEGMDPDDIVNRDAQEWQRILEAAKPVVMHVMETLAANQDLDDPKAKSEIAAQVLPLIQEVPSPVERDTYRQRLARLLRVDESALMSEPVAARRPPRRRTAPPQGEQKAKLELVQSPAASNYALEAYALGVLLRRPDLLYRVDREMQKFGLTRLASTDFLHADNQAILRLLQESIAQDMAEPLNYILNNLSLPMMEVADDLLARTEKMDPSDERVLSDLLRALLDLRSRNLRQDIEYLRHLMVDAQQQGDLRVEQYRQTMLNHATALHRLDQARGHYTGRAIHSH
jgi:DNA primase